MLGLLADLLTLLVGVVYPAYGSFKAIKYKNVNGYVRWMCYWVVYAGYTVCEATIGKWLLFWFPFYDVIRVGIIIWIAAPCTQGSQVLYKYLVHPKLNHYEAQIDATCLEYVDVLNQGASGVLRFAAATIAQSVVRLNSHLISYAQTHMIHYANASMGQIQYSGSPPVNRQLANQTASADNIGTDVSDQSSPVSNFGSNDDQPQSSRLTADYSRSDRSRYYGNSSTSTKTFEYTSGIDQAPRSGITNYHSVPQKPQASSSSVSSFSASKLSQRSAYSTSTTTSSTTSNKFSRR